MKFFFLKIFTKIILLYKVLLELLSKIISFCLRRKIESLMIAIILFSYLYNFLPKSYNYNGDKFQKITPRYLDLMTNDIVAVSQNNAYIIEINDIIKPQCNYSEKNDNICECRVYSEFVDFMNKYANQSALLKIINIKSRSPESLKIELLGIPNEYKKHFIYADLIDENNNKLSEQLVKKGLALPDSNIFNIDKDWCNL
jgi:hypothetical protein